MTDDDATKADGEISSGPDALWAWIAILIVMSMGVAVVVALIQTHAQ